MNRLVTATARSLCALSALLLCASCPRAGAPAQQGKPATVVEVSIVGTADLHGRVWRLPRLAGYVNALRAARPGRVVLIDSGDMMQGTLESDLNEGEAVFAAYRQLRYDAVAVGNHEFDYGPEGKNPTPQSPKDDPRGALKARARQAMGAFPVLAANLRDGGRLASWANVVPSTIVALAGGLRVGIVGVTTEDTPRVTISANFRGLAVAPLAATIAAEAASLRRRGAHVVVVAAHAGGRCKDFTNPEDVASCDPGAEIFAVARALPRGAVDAIFGGHMHAGVAHRVAGLPIVEAYAYGVAFSRVDLTYDPAAGKVVSSRIHSPTRIDGPTATSYEGKPIIDDPVLAALAAAARERAKVRRGEPLGVEIDQAMTRSFDEESALGNFVSAMILDVAPRARLAVMNGGGLRADLPAGRLSYGALYDVMPFDNRLALVTMTGKELKGTIARNLRDRVGILSLAGGRIAARCEAQELIIDVLVERERKTGLAAAPGAADRPLAPLRDEDDVVVATNDFLATGGDGFPRMPRMEVPPEGPALRDAIAEKLRATRGTVQSADWLVAGSPRFKLPRPRPVRCGELAER